jgi:phytoene dehydrogenase-like protein
MQLHRLSCEILSPDPRVFAPTPDGKSLFFYNDTAKTAEGIAQFSEKDAAKYAEFAATLESISEVLTQIVSMTPPAIDKPSPEDFWNLFQTGRGVRRLGKEGIFNLFRWAPMAVADFVAEFFETELLRAVIAARGMFGNALGPWSAGSTAVLLLRAAADPHPVGTAAFPRGGLGSLARVLAESAKEAGAEIRTDAEVAEIRVRDGAAISVVLKSGEEIPAKAIISNADPKRTLLKLVDPAHLSPGFAEKLQHYRMMGTVAKINLALGALPNFTAIKNGNAAALSGRIQISHGIDYLERAFDESKYGEFSKQPYLEVTIPSLTDPTLAPSGKHVMSIYMQYAPYKLKGDWDAQRGALGDAVVNALAQYAPDLPGLVLDGQIITPKDLEDTYGLTAGQIFHGELALDQFFTMRPLLDWARYRTPIANLYLCGSGTHPGAGLTGGSGANAAREILKDLKK